MKEIKLRRSELVALVDDDDFEKIGHLKWYAENVGHTFYVMRYFYNYEKKRKDHKRMHREILDLRERKIVVDHIDHNGLNNQKSNLRICTQCENLRNSRIRSDNSTGFKGVSLFKGSRVKAFRARIMIHGKEFGLGYFKTAEEAAMARDRKTLEVHGKFALLNFPERFK